MVGGKALADTMESLLGASFSEGGIAMALQVGHRLGLAFGGEVSWRERFEKLHGGKEQERWMVPPNLVGLVEKLEEVGGYRVRNPRLFVQAITHRSYQLGATSYEREEFLGDGSFFLSYPSCASLMIYRSATGLFHYLVSIQDLPRCDQLKRDVHPSATRLEFDSRFPRYSSTRDACDSTA